MEKVYLLSSVRLQKTGFRMRGVAKIKEPQVPQKVLDVKPKRPPKPSEIVRKIVPKGSQNTLKKYIKNTCQF